MRIYYIILYFFLICCIEQKFEKPPKSNYKEFRNTQPFKKMYYYLNLGSLKINSDSLYCKMYDNDCIVINGKTTIFNYYLAEGSDVKNLIPYNYAKGEFLEGKYHGVWEYYDKEGKVIKIEKWDKGKLINKE